VTISRTPRWYCPVALGALLCGSFDLIFAFVYYGLKFHAKPEGILRSIAAGWLGGPASKVGLWPVWLGGISHSLIATAVAGTFWLAARQWPMLLRRATFVGLVYGGAVYCLMNWVVVPLSASPMRAGFPKIDWIAFTAHLVLVGLPVALVTSRYVRRDEAARSKATKS
jgi:hypothetical protein